MGSQRAGHDWETFINVEYSSIQTSKMNKQMIYQLSIHLFNLELLLVIRVSDTKWQNWHTWHKSKSLKENQSLPVQITETPKSGAVGLRSQNTLNISTDPPKMIMLGSLGSTLTLGPNMTKSKLFLLTTQAVSQEMRCKGKQREKIVD